jgi:hypothetical protein
MSRIKCPYCGDVIYPGTDARYHLGYCDGIYEDSWDDDGDWDMDWNFFTYYVDSLKSKISSAGCYIKGSPPGLASWSK